MKLLALKSELGVKAGVRMAEQSRYLLASEWPAHLPLRSAAGWAATVMMTLGLGGMHAAGAAVLTLLGVTVPSFGCATRMLLVRQVQGCWCNRYNRLLTPACCCPADPLSVHRCL